MEVFVTVVEVSEEVVDVIDVLLDDVDVVELVKGSVNKFIYFK